MEVTNTMADNFSTLSIIAVIGALVVGIGGTAWYMQGQQAEQASLVGQETDFDGAFVQVQPLQEINGYNDLTVNTQALNDSTTTVADSNIVTKYNINESDGDSLRFAAGFEVDGPMQAVDVEVVNEGVDTNLDITDVKVVPDEDDEANIASVTPTAQFTADSDDEVDSTINGLAEGEYAFVLEVRGTDTAGISTDDDLYTVNMDADTDADSDEAEEMHFTIDNAAP